MLCSLCATVLAVTKSAAVNTTSPAPTPELYSNGLRMWISALDLKQQIIQMGWGCSSLDNEELREQTGAELRSLTLHSAVRCPLWDNLNLKARASLMTIDTKRGNI